jgi:hypothetical protein
VHSGIAIEGAGIVAVDFLVRDFCGLGLRTEENSTGCSGMTPLRAAKMIR